MFDSYLIQICSSFSTSFSAFQRLPLASLRPLGREHVRWVALECKQSLLRQGAPVPSGVIDLGEGSLKVKLPTIWTNGKAGGKSQRIEEKRENQRRERVRGKKMQAREKVERPRFPVFFP